MAQLKRLSVKRLILLGLCLAIAVLLCCVWIRTDSGQFARGRFFLWNASALINGLTAESPWLESLDPGTAGLITTAIAVMAYVWLAFIFFELLQSLWSTLSPDRRLRLGGFVAPAVFSVLTVALPLILDILGEWGAVEALQVSAVPYALAAVCFFALTVNLVLDDEPSTDNAGAAADEAPAVLMPQTLPQKAAMPRTGAKEPGRTAPAAPPAEKKTGGGPNVPYRTVGSVRLFPITMYDVRARLRPVYAGLDRDRTAIQLRFISYSGASVSAVRADVELVTPFKETVKLENLAFTELLEKPLSFGREYISEFLRLDADRDFLRQVHEIRVYLRSAVCDGKPFDMPGNMSYTRSGMEPGRLEELRRSCGIDAMELPGVREKGWLCCCGRMNGKGDTRCHICGRERGGWLPQDDAVAYCSKCGARLTGQQIFCYRCGTQAKR